MSMVKNSSKNLCPKSVPQTIHSQHTVQKQFFIEDGNKTRQSKVSYNGSCGCGALLPSWILEIKSKMDNKSARRVQRLCEGLTPSAQTLYVSESNAGSCDIINIYIASSG